MKKIKDSILQNTLFFQFIGLSALYFFHLGHILFPFYKVLAIFILIQMFPRQRIELVTVFSVLSFIAYSNSYETVKYGDIIHLYANNLKIVEKIISISLLFLIFYLLKKIILFIHHRAKISSLSLSLVFIPAASALLYFAIRQLEIDSSFFSHFFLPTMLAKSIWFFLIYVKLDERAVAFKQKIFSLLQTFPPFSIQRYEAREFLDLNRYIVKNAGEALDQAKYGLFMLLRGISVVVAFEFLGGLIMKFYVNQFQLSGYENRTFEFFFLELPKNFPTISTSFLWLLVIYSCIEFLSITYYGYFGIFLGIARLAGFKFTETTNKPWLATSFGDFCWRFMYYYSFILLNYFYYPLLGVFSRWGFSQRIRKYLALFTAVYVGGLYFHLMNDFYHLLYNSFFKVSWFYIKNFSPLFLVWAFCICIGEKFKLKHSPGFLFFTFNILLYSIISSLRLVYKFESASAVIDFYMKLLGMS